MSINIDIDGEWGIQSDSLQYFLGEWTTRIRKIDGEEVEIDVLKNKTSHKKLSDVITHYTKAKVMNSNCESLKEVIELLKEIDKTLNKIADELEV